MPTWQSLSTRVVDTCASCCEFVFGNSCCWNRVCLWRSPADAAAALHSSKLKEAEEDC